MASQKQFKVSASELKPGMYVARLDRPWAETPFLFQGFFIREQEDIEELQRYCEFVYVDLEQQDHTRSHPDTQPAPPEAPRANTPAIEPLQLSPHSAHARYGNRTMYVNSRPMEAELEQAREVYAEANRAVREMLVRLDHEGRLDVKLAREAVAPMVESVLRNPDAMVWLSRMKQVDSYIYQHSVGASVWGIAFGRHLGLNKQSLQELGLGCMLFDVGKTKLPQGLLNKHENLTPAEWQIVRNHVDYGLTLLENTEGTTPRVLSLVRGHHERFDGSGYPDGLKGNQIPTFAKIAAIVDCYHALTSLRPYARQRTPYEAVREIYGWRATLFQPEVVEQFMLTVGAFPTGSLVELNNGAVAVVVSQNQNRRLRPRVMLILDEKKRRLEKFISLDLMSDSFAGADNLWVDKCLEAGAYGIDPQELYL